MLYSATNPNINARSICEVLDVSICAIAHGTEMGARVMWCDKNAQFVAEDGSLQFYRYAKFMTVNDTYTFFRSVTAYFFL